MTKPLDCQAIQTDGKGKTDVIECEEMILPGDYVQRMRDGRPIGKPMIVKSVDMPNIKIRVERDD